MDKYKVIKFLNQGSFGKIYLVERREEQQQFAMKTIKLAGINRYQRSSILTEVKILLTNTSEYLLKCYDLFIHRQRLCIVTEYVDKVILINTSRKIKLLATIQSVKYFSRFALVSTRCILIIFCIGISNQRMCLLPKLGISRYVTLVYENARIHKGHKHYGRNAVFHES